MKPQLSVLLFALFSLHFACNPTDPDPRLDQPEEFKKLLDAHGDWGKWLSAKSFSFAMIHETTLEMENHYIDLAERKVRIDSETWQIGNDGEKVWVSPSREAFRGPSVRFYHDLYFRLFSIPYLFTDPGVVVKPVEDKLVNGQSYETLQVDFAASAERASGDSYYLLIDPQSGRLAWVLYNLTFFASTSTKLDAVKFEEYRDAGGLVFPRFLTGYHFENDSAKRISYQVSFSDVFLLEETLDEKIFKMPENAVVAKD